MAASHQRSNTVSEAARRRRAGEWGGTLAAQSSDLHRSNTLASDVRIRPKPSSTGPSSAGPAGAAAPAASAAAGGMSVEGLLNDWDQQLAELGERRRTRLTTETEKKTLGSWLRQKLGGKQPEPFQEFIIIKEDEAQPPPPPRPSTLVLPPETREPAQSDAVPLLTPAAAGERVLAPVTRRGWVTKMGYTVTSWRRRYMQLDGPNLKYFASPPIATPPTRPRGALQLAYYPGEGTAVMTEVTQVDIGSPIDPSATAHPALAGVVPGPHTLRVRNACAGSKVRTFYFALDSAREAILWQTAITCNRRVHHYTPEARTEFVQAATGELERQGLAGEQLWSTLKELTRANFAGFQREQYDRDLLMAVAASPGDIEQLVDALACGATDVVEDTGADLLAVAARAGNDVAVQLLALNGFNVNARDDAGNTALHLAAINGLTETCELLLSLGAERHAANHQGHSAAHLAANIDLAGLLAITPFEDDSH
eukprot:m.57082 g.57082  ORF g.57082 m.57082 type:complete len:482 (+) comp12084_c0_seq1:147-1592(+)